MRTDERQEEEDESPEHPGLMQRLGHAVTVRELGMIDRTIGLFQRWRNRIEPPAAEEDWRSRHRAAAAATAAPVEPASAARHGRLRGVLIVVALLLAAAIAGMTFSYSLLRKTLAADDMIIDDLRDQLTQMDKAEARNLSTQTREQNQIAEYKKAMRVCEAKIQDYEDQAAQLRQQIATLTPPPPQHEATVVTAGPRRSPSPPPSRTAQQKTGNCVAAGGSAAADLARCVDDFNRP